MSARASAVLTGTVKWFSEQKGFGFIVRDDGQEDLFVHHSDIDGKGYTKLRENDRVQFQVGEGKRGPKAVQVRML